MSSLVQALEGVPGSFLALVREDGSVERCELVAAPTAPAFGFVHSPAAPASLPFFVLAAPGVLVAGAPMGTALVYEGSPLFALFGSTPRIIYTGPDCVALVRVVASMPVLIDSFRNALGVALNGDLVGLSIVSDAFFQAGGQCVNDNITAPPPAELGNTTRTLVTERRVALTSGDSLGPVWGAEQVPVPGAQIAAGYTMSVQVVE